MFEPVHFNIPDTSTFKTCMEDQILSCQLVTVYLFFLNITRGKCFMNTFAVYFMQTLRKAGITVRHYFKTVNNVAGAVS